jgi:hypothetical protein
MKSAVVAVRCDLVIALEAVVRDHDPEPVHPQPPMSVTETCS